jgi:hypothetical protein
MLGILDHCPGPGGRKKLVRGEAEKSFVDFWCDVLI